MPLISPDFIPYAILRAFLVTAVSGISRRDLSSSLSSAGDPLFLPAYAVPSGSVIVLFSCLAVFLSVADIHLKFLPLAGS